MSTRVRLVATAMALLFAAGATTSDSNSAMASAESAMSTRAPASFVGTYRVEVLGSQGRFNGEPYPGEDTARWYALTSECAALGCTARATQLDDGNPAFPHPRGRTFGLRFQRDHWVTEPLVDTSPCLADPTQDVAVAVSWRLDPQPDGTLTGTRTLTEVSGGTGACAGSGGEYVTPVVLTRVPEA